MNVYELNGFLVIENNDGSGTILSRQVDGSYTINFHFTAAQRDEAIRWATEALVFWRIEGGNFDRLGSAPNAAGVPVNRQAIESLDEAREVYVKQLEWEIGSGYIQDDFSIPAEVNAKFAGQWPAFMAVVE